MLFIVLLFLAVSSIALFFLKRDRQTLLMLGLCFSFICMFVGIIIYQAKTGGLTYEQKLFLFFDTRIQRKLSYLIFPLRKLGYMIAIGRYLFPAFLLLIGINYSMIPALLRHKKKWMLVFILPAASLIIYYPEIFFEIVKSRFTLQVFLMKATVAWIYLYLLAAVFLIIYEYISMTMPYCKRQFRYIMVFLLSVTVQYWFYCVQDPIQVYQMYSSEYMRFTGRLYTNTLVGIRGWFLFTLLTLFFVVLGFWNLKNYTMIDYAESKNEIQVQRKFDTASMGVSVFVHSIKNQLLSNRILCRKMIKELSASEPDLSKTREYAKMLDDVNESMISRMEELYKSIKSSSISLSPTSSREVINRTLELFEKKYPGVEIKVLAGKEESVLADIRHLSEAIYNLLTNAYEAILASGKEQGETKLIVHSERLYVVFEVRDEGMGISKADQRKIFDPFYTSKNTSYNWGMGLYYVRQIVKSHLGMLKLESRPLEGTSFFVMIPRYEPRGAVKKSLGRKGTVTGKTEQK